MSARRIAAIALTGAAVAGGTGAAIAAVTNDDAKKAEQAVLDDAAKRLDVTPEKLREALAAAQDAQLDQAVRDGKLTQRQADAIKQRRRQSGRVLGGPVLEHPRFRGHGRAFGALAGPRGALFSDLAKALGITTAQLHERLHDGKTIADIAKAEGKSLGSVRSALKSAARARADKAVADGDITRAQADAMLERLDAVLANLDRRLLSPRGRRFHHGGPPPLPPDIRPGSVVPGDAPPPEPLPPIDPPTGIFS
jgi:hypothetical protein